MLSPTKLNPINSQVIYTVSFTNLLTSSSSMVVSVRMAPRMSLAIYINWLYRFHKKIVIRCSNAFPTKSISLYAHVLFICNFNIHNHNSLNYFSNISPKGWAFVTSITRNISQLVDFLTCIPETNNQST